MKFVAGSGRPSTGAAAAVLANSARCSPGAAVHLDSDRLAGVHMLAVLDLGKGSLRGPAGASDATLAAASRAASAGFEHAVRTHLSDGAANIVIADPLPIHPFRQPPGRFPLTARSGRGTLLTMRPHTNGVVQLVG